jgi:protein-S-isoprenylcysteine O-methyltransferase Ste14
MLRGLGGTAAIALMRTSLVPPPIWMLIFGVAMWAVNRHWPLLTIVPGTWIRLGWGLMAIAPIAPVAAFVEFRRANTTVNPHKPESASRLVTSGVYRWTRNPMYLGLSILLWGWAIELGTLSAFMGPLLFVAVIQHVQIRPEEHALRMRFGKDYETYCGRVNRWLGKRA